MFVCRRYYCWILLAPVCASGCGPFFGLPRIWPPASESTQIARAKQFDPYPDPTIGPPVIGGRPQGFLYPRPDPDPNKTTRDWTTAAPGVSYPPPAYYPNAAPVYGPPTAAYPAAVPQYPGAVAYPAPAVTYPSAVSSPAAAPIAPSSVSVAPVAAPIAYGKKIDSP
jgi:hypothetical protein